MSESVAEQHSSNHKWIIGVSLLPPSRRALSAFSFILQCVPANARRAASCSVRPRTAR